jgi:hypothetical protein
LGGVAVGVKVAVLVGVFVAVAVVVGVNVAVGVFVTVAVAVGVLVGRLEQEPTTLKVTEDRNEVR